MSLQSAPSRRDFTPALEVATIAAEIKVGRHHLARRIVEATADHFDLSIAQLCGQRKLRSICQARYIAAKLMCELTGLSTPEIGLKLGGKDHTTVLHNLHRADELLVTNTLFRSDYEAIKARIEAAE